MLVEPHAARCLRAYIIASIIRSARTNSINSCNLSLNSNLLCTCHTNYQHQPLKQYLLNELQEFTNLMCRKGSEKLRPDLNAYNIRGKIINAQSYPCWPNNLQETAAVKCQTFDFFSLDLFSEHHASASVQSRFRRASMTFRASKKMSISTSSCKT